MTTRPKTIAKHLPRSTFRKRKRDEDEYIRKRAKIGGIFRIISRN